jgi:hypothetical protein
MTRIVERCPNCGVEHDVAEVGECEACGSPLRYWCRTHSREIGWLESAECPRCPPGTARVKPRPAPPPSPPTPRATDAATAPPPPPAASSPVVTPPAPMPAPAPAPAAPAARSDEPEPRRAKEAPGQGPIVRLFNAVLTTLQGGILGVLFGVGAGGFQAFYMGGDIPRTAVEWGVYGGMLGLLVGGLGALGALMRSPSPPER